MTPDRIVEILVLVLGSSGLGIVAKSLFDRRKISSEAEKTNIDAAAVLSASSLALIEPYRKQLLDLGQLLDRTSTRANDVEERLRVTNNDLRDTRDLMTECNRQLSEMQGQLRYYYDRYGPPTDQVRLVR